MINKMERDIYITKYDRQDGETRDTYITKYDGQGRDQHH